MQHEGLQPDGVTFLHVLKACGSTQDLFHGRYLHNQIIDSVVSVDAATGNSLVGMYAKCGSIEEAFAVFQSLPIRDAISWGAMIAGYVAHDKCDEAVHLFCRMPIEEMFSSKAVIAYTLKACGSIKALSLGRLIHDKIEKSGTYDSLIGNALLNMYSLFGLIDEAQRVFDRIQDKTVHMWGEMIAGHAGHNLPEKALQIFDSMNHKDLKFDKFSCLQILKACGSLGAVRQGRVMYDHAVRAGLDSDTMIGNTLIDVFAKCGSIEEAQKVFFIVKNPDVISWTVMIAGYAERGDGNQALFLFKKMQAKGLVPSKVSYLGALKACGTIKNLERGRKIHDQIANTELMSDVLIGATLIDMYAKCGSISEARELFDCLPNRNIVVWGAMMAGYAQHGHGVDALELYKMMQHENLSPDKVLFSSVLQGCASVGYLYSGRLLHDRIIRDGFESQVIVGNTLIDLYIKCGLVEEARTVFDCLINRDTVTWATMIAGYAQYNFNFCALKLFENSLQRGIALNKVVLLGLLKACGSIKAIQLGQLVHHYVLKGGLEGDLAVCNTLIDMYGKSGSLREAHRVFDGMKHKDEVSWSALIIGYAWCSDWNQVQNCLKTIQGLGMKLDNVTFTSILTACSHGGLVEEGQLLFRSMMEEHNIVPRIEHYSCLIDLLSRNGCLLAAKDLLRSIPLPPDMIIWVSLLTSCQFFGHGKMGTDCFGHSFYLDPNDPSSFMLMAKLCADGSWHLDTQKMSELKGNPEGQSNCALAWIEVGGKINEFITGDHG
ncbi:hypothetical protein KP509_13G057100 [Ceratopteris richardii]|nr:hypothetical protein KP509_13G057100 [Ceratopteris richardii]